MASFGLVGPGRAGRSMAAALEAKGWTLERTWTSADDTVDAALGVDLLIIATPDDVIAEIAARVEPVRDTLVIHLSGSRTLECVERHPRHGSIHPLASLPDPITGAERILGGCPLAVAGDPEVRAIAATLTGRVLDVDDARRAAYHATACVAANHVVALCAQVERLAEVAAVDADAFLELASAAIDTVRARGASGSLTGPAARGDVATLRSHVDALPIGERPLYRALAAEAARIAGRDVEDAWR